MQVKKDMVDTLEAEDSAGTISPGLSVHVEILSVNKAWTKFPTGGMYANLAQALLQSKNHFVRLQQSSLTADTHNTMFSKESTEIHMGLDTKSGHKK